VARLDEDVVLALFERPEDDGPVVVVFFPMSNKIIPRNVLIIAKSQFILINRIRRT